MAHAISISKLQKIYPPEKKGGKSFTAVDQISFDLEKGEILGLLGPNGAGKSTTISMLLGVLTPTSGTIKYGTKDFVQYRSEILQSVTFASTYIKMPWRLSVMENLTVYGYMYGLSRAEFYGRTKKFLQFFDVWGQRNKTMNELSAGQITRIMLAKAFIPYPKIVLLDEPTASLDPDVSHEVRQFVLAQQKEYDTSILYTSHNMDEVAEVCDRIVFLQHGKVIATGTPADLASSVSVAHMQLTGKSGTKEIEEFARAKGLKVKKEMREVEIAIDEHEIAGFLQQMGNEKIEYTQISITKPTLEDYFLSQTKKKDKAKGE
jgi:ABC-2 type transport system ATP-binding protein